MFHASATFIALLQCAGALRKSDQGAKVAGIPIKNYRYRHLQNYDGPEVGRRAIGEYDWVVKFRDGLEDDRLKDFCEGGCRTRGHPQKGGVPLATVRATEENLASLIERHPGLVEYVEPDTPVEAEDLVEAEDSVKQDRVGQWSHGAINLGDAQFDGEGVNIYVMDTGVRVSHRDFEGRAIPTIDTFKGGGDVYECNGDRSCAGDTRGHGTHVAGTTGGKSYGVATKALIRAMKVCCGSGSNIIAGMDWISQYADKPAVMTMSLGSYSTPYSSKVAVESVVNSGVTVIVSAGNRGTESCLKSYTFISAAIGVGASTEGMARATFSNWGSCNAIFAPGYDIVSASKDSDYGSETKSGTSMAAPAVAGAAAMLLQQNPNLTPNGVRNTLRSRATKDKLKYLRTGDPNLLLNVGW